MKQKVNILKFISLCIIAAVFLYANINMVRTLFFSGSGNNRILYIKNAIIPSNEEIAALVGDIYLYNEADNGEKGLLSLREAQRRGNLAFQAKSQKLIAKSLLILDDPGDNRKRYIKVNGDTTGYVYIIHERVPCSYCSDFNYLLIADTEYRINNFIFLADIVNGKQIIPHEAFEKYTDRFLNKNLLTGEFENINTAPEYERHSKYFKKSIISLQTQVRLSNETHDNLIFNLNY